MEWFVLSSEDIVVFMEMEMLPPRPPWWMAAWPVLNHYGPGRGYLAAFEPRNWPTDRSHFSLYEVIFEELPSWSFKSAPTFLMSFGAVALDAEDLWVGMRSFRRKRDCRLACDSFGPHGSGWGVGGGAELWTHSLIDATLATYTQWKGIFPQGMKLIIAHFCPLPIRLLYPALNELRWIAAKIPTGWARQMWIKAQWTWMMKHWTIRRPAIIVRAPTMDDV